MQYFRFFSPQRVLDVSQSIQIALYGIVGGWQSVFGPMIGGFIMVPVAEQLRLNLTAFPALSPIIYGVILMLFILFMPNGVNEPIMRGIKWLETKYWRPSGNANNEKAGRQ
jgi:branched-chain amino acid transport system permease protein